MPDVRIGISGWSYPGWRGTFYPPGLPPREQLGFVAARMNSVEVNRSFYALLRPGTYAAWAAEAPDDFVFAVKGSRYVTHLRKLAGVETGLANLFASGVMALGTTLGPFLWQLPPTLAFDADRLDTFLRLLPRTAGQLVESARNHDERVSGRALTEFPPGVPADRPVRHAMEVRHPSFDHPEFVELARRHEVAVVVADTAGRWPFLDVATADFAYARLHGDAELYVSGYDDAALDTWVERVRAWTASGRDAFVYFDNDVKVRAPVDAMALAARLRHDPLPHAARVASDGVRGGPGDEEQAEAGQPRGEQRVAARDEETGPGRAGRLDRARRDGRRGQQADGR